MVDKKESNNGIPTLEENHYLLFNKDFDSSSTGDAIRFIIERNLMEKTPESIKMILNSSGGEVPSAFALIDIMRNSKVPVYTYGLGEIASCGLLTFIAGVKGKRYITRNTSILSHQFFWFNAGKEHELMAKIKEFDLTSQRIIDHYKKCTGMVEADIKKYLLPPEDVWLSSKEAIKYGLADEIITSI